MPASGGVGCGHALARWSIIQRQCDESTRRSSTMDIWKLWLALNLLQVIFVRSEERVRSWSKSREKRFLIWNDSGSSKMSISMSVPANLYDKKKWRSFNLTYNIQFQYNIPPKPFYWWNATYFKLSRSNSAANFVQAPETNDFTQMYIYAALRNYMDKAGADGQQCMQRVICQNAQVGRVEGLMERIYQRLLTPEDTSEEYYRDAYVEGSKGVDCLKTYSRCPIGRCLLDQFVQYA